MSQNTNINGTTVFNENDIFIMNLEPIKRIERIMELYGDEIKRLVYTYLKNHTDTDDVTQEIFITIYQKFDRFQGKSSLRSWIYAIAINKSKDYLKSMKRKNKQLWEKLFRNFEKTSSPSAEATYLNHVEGSELLLKVLSLPLKYREVIFLYYFYDFSTKEMADILQTKDATIRTRLARARQLLKDELIQERGILDG